MFLVGELRSLEETMLIALSLFFALAFFFLNIIIEIQFLI